MRAGVLPMVRMALGLEAQQSDRCNAPRDAHHAERHPCRLEVDQGAHRGLRPSSARSRPRRHEIEFSWVVEQGHRSGLCHIHMYARTAGDDDAIRHAARAVGFTIDDSGGVSRTEEFDRPFTYLTKTITRHAQGTVDAQEGLRAHLDLNNGRIINRSASFFTIDGRSMGQREAVRHVQSGRPQPGDQLSRSYRAAGTKPDLTLLATRSAPGSPRRKKKISRVRNLGSSLLPSTPVITTQSTCREMCPRTRTGMEHRRRLARPVSLSVPLVG